MAKTLPLANWEVAPSYTKGAIKELATQSHAYISQFVYLTSTMGLRATHNQLLTIYTLTWAEPTLIV